MAQTIMNRLGFHYFPDTQHYRQQDLQIWLPRLRSLGACWLVLNAPTNRAIPENFIRALIEAKIQPMLHFQIQPSRMPDLEDMQLLFNTYHRWGVRYVTLFDQPNLSKVWQASTWTQANLVEHFLDLYLPLANASLQAYLTPVFPPLKPGGDYWDTAFLRQALRSLQRRGQHNLLAHLVIGAYSCPGKYPLQWGAGGPERWPNARPYDTPPGIEDHRGFRIFDWYSAISQAALSTIIPIFLFGMGYSSDKKNHVKNHLIITRLLSGEFVEGYEAIPREVIGGAFGPLVDPGGDSLHGWFRRDGRPHSLAQAILQWAENPSKIRQPAQNKSHRIRHYLLLPSYEWGISDYHLNIIRPFIKKHQPTIGFSLDEAQNARRVTVIGGTRMFSEASLNQLRAAGVFVERVDEDGTDIASKLTKI